jgi:hypothetical protein
VVRPQPRRQGMISPTTIQVACLNIPSMIRDVGSFQDFDDYLKVLVEYQGTRVPLKGSSFDVVFQTSRNV